MVLQDFVTQLLAHMGMDTATVDVVDSPDSLLVTIRVEEQESGLLIGRHAETLDSLQHILRLLFQREANKPITLNINDFREHREEYLHELAERVAQRVITTGRPQTLRLSPSERRIIHLALSTHESVATQSEGDGDYRVLKVFLKNN